MKTWVFPILRLLLFAAIAIALVKIAFFPDVAVESSPEQPTGEIVQPQVAVTIGSVQNTVQLTGTINAVEAVPMPATGEGVVTKVWVEQGQRINKGAPVLEVKSTTITEEGDELNKWATMVAPATGRISNLTALVGQSFVIGDVVGQIAPSAHYVSGSIPPDQLYRLVDRPDKATITIKNGPAPFECTGLTISSSLAGADPETGESSGGPTVSCKVPKGVRVFPGLSADIAIAGGSADDVLIVPTTAVEGLAESGNVYVLLEDGTEEVRPVKLGINDGSFVEILEGLAEGDMILEFVPGAEEGQPGMGGECFVDEMGNEICEEILL